MERLGNLKPDDNPISRVDETKPMGTFPTNMNSRPHSWDEDDGKIDDFSHVMPVGV